MNTKALRTHWFFLVAPVVLAGWIYATKVTLAPVDRVLEIGLLFDLVVLVPCLYWLCYRARGRRAVLRAVALACLGIWVALKLIPESEHEVLSYIAPLRWVGLAALIWLEIKVVVAIYKSVFKGGSTAQAVALAPADLPPWVARLLALEAKIWLTVWQFLKRIAGKR
jgi:hypothetical protein